MVLGTPAHRGSEPHDPCRDDRGRGGSPLSRVAPRLRRRPARRPSRRAGTPSGWHGHEASCRARRPGLRSPLSRRSLPTCRRIRLGRLDLRGRCRPRRGRGGPIHGRGRRGTRPVAFLGYMPAAISLDSHAKLHDVSGDDVPVILGDSSFRRGSFGVLRRDRRPGRRAWRARPVTASADVVGGPGWGAALQQVLFLACSGAQTKNVARTPEDGEPWLWTGRDPAAERGGRHQLDMLAAETERTGTEPKTTVMSLGGNDTGS